MRFKPLSMLLPFFFVLIFLPGVSHGGSSLLISKTRIVFEKRYRADTVLLKNTGDLTGKYRVFLVNKKMGTDGHISDIVNPSPEEMAVKKMIRFSPRLVELKPGATQTIRIMARKPRDLASGEYRCHLTFQGRPQTSVSENSETAPGQIGVSFSPILEYSIPIIIRHGQVRAAAQIGDISFLTHQKTGMSKLKIILKREGNRSLYGDMEIFITKNQKIEKRIGLAKGIALYTTTPLRPVNLPIELSGWGAEQKMLPLLVRFTESKKYGGDQVAEKNIQLELAAN
nr:fimbria/pilus periplasmic chaperone [uncultured Desulfobacter sp.]